MTIEEWTRRPRAMTGWCGLMQYGSVLGHGAYLGPDYTAEYLRMVTEDVAGQWRAQGVADPKERVVAEFRTNRYNPDTKTLVFTGKQAVAFDHIQREVIWPSSVSLQPNSKTCVRRGCGITPTILVRPPPSMGRCRSHTVGR